MAERIPHKDEVAGSFPATGTNTMTIYTIGHSTRSISDFIHLLKTSNVKVLCDIRSMPGSRFNPQFSQESFKQSLASDGIRYVHMPLLGGLRSKGNPDSIHTAWRNKSFRNYADYMQTDDFKQGLEDLEKVASEASTAYMCSEAVHWRCHRSLVSDALDVRGWTVLHIGGSKPTQHRRALFARVEGDQLIYDGNQGRLDF